jgi:hypothetical protein
MWLTLLAPYLYRLACRGVPAPSTALPWSLCQKDEAFKHGPHPSVAHQFTFFLLEDMHDMVRMGYWVVLPYDAVRSSTHLKLSQCVIIPQRE